MRRRPCQLRQGISDTGSRGRGPGSVPALRGLATRMAELSPGQPALQPEQYQGAETVCLDHLRQPSVLTWAVEGYTRQVRPPDGSTGRTSRASWRGLSCSRTVPAGLASVAPAVDARRAVTNQTSHQVNRHPFSGQHTQWRKSSVVP